MLFILLKEEYFMANFDQQLKDLNKEGMYGSQDIARSTFAEHMGRVYGWMFLGLVMTAAVAYYVFISNIAAAIFSNPMIWIVLMLAEIGLVVFLSSRILKMSFVAATASFMLYSALNGLTLSMIFIAYQLGSIAVVFGITALLFGSMSVVGLVTKRDLSKMGPILLVGLFGIIIASIVNLFLKSSPLYYIISYLGIAIFLGLTAYDSNKIKKLYSVYGGTEKEGNIAILGSLSLYLDFVNLLLFLLRIFGRRR
jgi:FtsH-binding integral membrane protein